MIFASHDRQLLGALSSRVLEPSAEGSRVYDGGYREYVAPTGRDAPGVR